MNNEQEITQLEDVLRTGKAGGFVESVAAAQDKNADMILMTMQAFFGEPELLYAAMRYAFLQGVEVRLAPQPQKVAA